MAPMSRGDVGGGVPKITGPSSPGQDRSADANNYLNDAVAAEFQRKPRSLFDFLNVGGSKLFYTPQFKRSKALVCNSFASFSSSLR